LSWKTIKPTADRTNWG